MKTFSAKTLQDAIILASKELNCSVVDLTYEVIQQPSNGFLGIGKKEAIISAISKKTHSVVRNSKASFDKQNMISDCLMIQQELSKMLSFMPYEIEKIKVEPYDKGTIRIYLDGKDTALLIGEKGYRYKALSYLLFNWISPTYGYNIRLEVAQFLSIQEEIIEQYLQSIESEILNSTEYRTKNLSGILGVIALKRLRELYPGRYICLKNEDNEQFVFISMMR